MMMMMMMMMKMVLLLSLLSLFMLFIFFFLLFLLILLMLTRSKRTHDVATVMLTINFGMPMLTDSYWFYLSLWKIILDYMLFPFYVVLAFSFSWYRISYKSSNFLNQAQYHQTESLTLHKNFFVRHKTSPSNKHHEAHIFRYLFWKSRLIFGLSSFTQKFRNVSGMTEGWCHLTSWPETMRVSLHHLIQVTWLLLLS